MKKINENLVTDLLFLRDELAKKGFDSQGRVVCTEYAVTVYKINSCLYKGYPLRNQSEE